MQLTKTIQESVGKKKGTIICEHRAKERKKKMFRERKKTKVWYTKPQTEKNI